VFLLFVVFVGWLFVRVYRRVKRREPEAAGPTIVVKY
jgi:hypothetical protein